MFEQILVGSLFVISVVLETLCDNTIQKVGYGVSSAVFISAFFVIAVIRGKK